MNYFSRLTDIVTCNLSQLLKDETDPVQALEKIIEEMDQGIAGARRSVTAARLAVDRMEGEISERRTQIMAWQNRAKTELQGGNESGARLALARKTEVEDLVAGLQQQHRAAQNTFEQLQTTERALESKKAEALRKLASLRAGYATDETEDFPQEGGISLQQDRNERINADLDALRKELLAG
ncbi:hypothetical protein Spb1_10920 [Planctopirus ephydatiae]|uniref:Phage shock protein A n=1 Tax=Planctopirus ephydatiae TaxID=2528019 RepID=A0A518GKZ5_9PLAN|nr:PspA/IM30 family protein [Planctopirus ephydatiae]QDV29214.1 hypothetical protein Spb1_10920 [Planctopirus ephydatiae]